MSDRKIPSIAEQMADHQKRIAKQREKEGLEPLPAFNLNEELEKCFELVEKVLRKMK